MVRKAPQPDLVDLHVHSTASDGVCAPREVVRRAAEVGLKAIALTDHDTVTGLAEAAAAGVEFGIEVIPGAEISAEFEAGACHLLGYFIDPADGPLGEVLAEAREGRARRNTEILARLRKLGFDLTMDEMTGRAGDGTLTRAHFAAVMLEKGYAKSWDEAFDKYLGRGKPAYVYRKRVTPEEAIAAIRGAGGLASLAHPRQLNRGAAETDEWIERLAAAGLEAVETASPDHTANYARRYRAAAERLGLLQTGGTDWHGREDVDIFLGLGRGAMLIHYDLVRQMKARLAARRPGPR
ncbi:MAG: PHP domain-containing protein [Planctomycetes bacterium]|nr:PHP domain-containing protein [Planctomycetota bacterium]